MGSPVGIKPTAVYLLVGLLMLGGIFTLNSSDNSASSDIGLVREGCCHFLYIFFSKPHHYIQKIEFHVNYCTHCTHICSYSSLVIDRPVPTPFSATPLFITLFHAVSPSSTGPTHLYAFFKNKKNSSALLHIGSNALLETVKRKYLSAML